MLMSARKPAVKPA